MSQPLRVIVESVSATRKTPIFSAMPRGGQWRAKSAEELLEAAIMSARVT
jgi:hypothetical protein